MSIIKHVTLQKIVAHDFRYVPRTIGLKVLPDLLLRAACSALLGVEIGCHMYVSEDTQNYSVMWREAVPRYRVVNHQNYHTHFILPALCTLQLT